jgi:hypothetical protein
VGAPSLRTCSAPTPRHDTRRTAPCDRLSGNRSQRELRALADTAPVFFGGTCSLTTVDIDNIVR